MLELVNGLADLCSLRDRDALDVALVSLILQASRGSASSVRLIQLIGEPDNLHYLVRAERRAHSPVCERRVVWVDWKDLPALPVGSALEQASSNGEMVTQAGKPCIAVLPLVPSAASMILLEVTSDAPLSEQAIGLMQAVLRLYRNFEGLLDYGEKDALTDLLNRKTFDSAFFKAALVHQASPEQQEGDRRQASAADGFWLAVLDIDHFKRVNDNFGHLIGDEVLLLMARLMRAHFRFQDQLYRFGGEEFVILLRCGAPQDAAGALERFRAVVQAYDFPQIRTITVSIGYAGLREDDTPGGAFDRADKAVYYAKEHGRNQVCSYQLLLDSGELSEEAVDANEIDFF